MFPLQIRRIPNAKKDPYQGFLHLKYLLRGIASKDFCLTKQFMRNDEQTVSRIIRKFPHRFNERNESKNKIPALWHMIGYI